jgi:hypothetical protein
MDLESSKFAPMLRALEEGSLQPSQLRAVSEALHIGMLNSALTSIQESDELLSKLKAMEDRAMEMLPAQFEVFIQTAGYKEIMEFLGSIASIRAESVKAKLKVYSTRDLFNINPISEDDRALLALFKMIGTDEKKNKLKRFLKELTSDAIDTSFTEDNLNLKEDEA